MSTDIVFQKESYGIIGACFSVFKELGSGFLEAVYQESLAIECTDRMISFVEKPKLKIVYKDKELKQTYEPDFQFFDKIILEIKAVKNLNHEHRSQIINYLKATENSWVYW